MISGITLVLLGAIFGWLANRWQMSISQDQALLSEHISDVEKYCDAARAYWLASPTDKDGDELLAAEVLAFQTAVAIFYGEAAKRMGGDEYRRYSLRISRLFNIATGGKFQTINRSRNISKSIEIYDYRTDLIHMLRVIRSNQQRRIIPRWK